MVILDVSIVNVALPSIRSGLHFSTTGLQWVVNAYTLTFAGLPDARRPLRRPARPARGVPRRHRRIRARPRWCARWPISQALLLGARGAAGRWPAPCSRRRRCRSSHSSLQEGAERNRGARRCGARWAASAPPPARCSAASSRSRSAGRRSSLSTCHSARSCRARPAGHPGGAARDRGADAPLRRSPARCSSPPGLAALTYGIVRTDTLGWGSPGVLAPLGRRALRCSAAFIFVEARVARVAAGAARDLPAAASCGPPTSSCCCSTRRCSRCGSS